MKDSKFHISCCLPYDTYYTLEEYKNSIFISFKYNIVNYSTNTLLYEKMINTSSININPITLGNYVELISFIPILTLQNYNNNNNSIPTLSISEAVKLYYLHTLPSVINIRGYVIRCSPFINEIETKSSSILLTIKDNNNKSYIIVRNDSKYYYGNIIKLYKEYAISNVILSKNNNKVNEKYQIYDSTEATSIIPLDNNNNKRMKCYYTKDTIKNIIGSEIIDYIGTVTDIIIDTVIQIDNVLYCLCSHISLIKQELGIRIGCKVYISGTHAIYDDKNQLIGIGLCYNSNVYIILYFSVFFCIFLYFCIFVFSLYSLLIYVYRFK